jgi:hypothetical protein
MEREAAVEQTHAAEATPTEEEAFYAAQEEAFADLRVYLSNRPRRKR